VLVENHAPRSNARPSTSWFVGRRRRRQHAPFAPARRAAARDGFNVFYPAMEFCTDNGAMIALAGAMRLRDAFVHVRLRFAIHPR